MVGWVIFIGAFSVFGVESNNFLLQTYYEFCGTKFAKTSEIESRSGAGTPSWTKLVKEGENRELRRANVVLGSTRIDIPRRTDAPPQDSSFKAQKPSATSAEIHSALMLCEKDFPSNHPRQRIMECVLARL
jgi:hypothetical protein